jgi:hypothetical protein
MRSRDGMMTSVRGEAPLRRGKGEYDASWIDMNLIGLKNEENLCGRFNYYKWTVKI